jgi:DNA-binding CsgD family transcriptional regulator
MTTTDSLGFFEFKGNLLGPENRIYRIHLDQCSENDTDINHFNGHCEDSHQFLFIAKNTDTISLPLSFSNEVFCEVDSKNPKADAFLKIDSLKNEMRFAYTELRNEAGRKLAHRKWFSTFQDFGESLNEPLAELAIYEFLSDRKGEFHNYYLNDLSENDYYEELKLRLVKTYPNSTYTNQYIGELEADQFILSNFQKNKTSFDWTYVLAFLLALSLIFNFIFLYKNHLKKKSEWIDLKEKLSKQELVVLELILDDKSNKDIAESLFLSLSTVKSHINNIYKKLNVSSRVEVKALFS